MFCFKKSGHGVSIGPWTDGTECDDNNQSWCQRGKCVKKLEPSCTAMYISKGNNPKTEKFKTPTQMPGSVNGTSAAAAAAANSIFLDLTTVCMCTIVMIINCAKLIYYYY